MATNEEIRAKDILPHKTSFSAGDGFYGDGNTSFFMEANKLLKLTAEYGEDEMPVSKSYGASSKIILMPDDYVKYSGKRWDVDGTLVDAVDRCATAKYRVDAFEKVISEIAASSLILWNKDNTVSVITGASEYNINTYTNAEFFAINFNPSIVINNPLTFKTKNSIYYETLEYSAAKGTGVALDQRIFLKEPHKVWGTDGTLSSSTFLNASHLFDASHYRAIKFNIAPHSIILIDSSNNTTLIIGTDTIIVADYPNLSKVGFNIHDLYLYSTILYTEGNPSSELGEFDSISRNSRFTKKACDSIKRLNWCWAAASGTFVFAEAFSSTEKYKISDYDYVLCSEPCYLFLWRSDNTYVRVLNSIGMLSSIYGDEFEYFAFNFSNSQRETMEFTFKAKSLIPKLPKAGYFYKPVSEDVGSIPDIDTLTSDAFVQRFYDPLVSKYPNYVTKQNIGKDASNTYDMYAYIFTPESGYDYTIYLQGGVHSMYEKQAYSALAILMNLISDKGSSDDYDPLICMLRQKCRFVVVPIVNVWNVTQWALYNNGDITTQPASVNFNSNGINLNRDWFSENPQQELVNIKTLLGGFSDIVFGFDCHTDPEGIPGWGSYLLEYANEMPAFFGERLKRVCGYLYEKNKITQVKTSGNTSLLWEAYRGNSWNYPLSSSNWANYKKGLSPDYTAQHLTTTCCNGFWRDFGILGGTLEHGAGKFGSGCDNREMTAAVELYANQIIEQVRCNVNLEKRIYHLENP